MKKGMLIGLFMLAMSFSDAGTAKAGCLNDTINCFWEASRDDSFVRRTAQALDCELDMVECIRRKILGR